MKPREKKEIFAWEVSQGERETKRERKKKSILGGSMREGKKRKRKSILGGSVRRETTKFEYSLKFMESAQIKENLWYSNLM